MQKHYWFISGLLDNMSHYIYLGMETGYLEIMGATFQDNCTKRDVKGTRSNVMGLHNS